MQTILAVFFFFISTVYGSWTISFPSNGASYKPGDTVTVLAIASSAVATGTPIATLSQGSLSTFVNLSAQGSGNTVYSANIVVPSTFTANSTATLTVSGGSTSQSVAITSASVTLIITAAVVPCNPCYPSYGCYNPCYTPSYTPSYTPCYTPSYNPCYRKTSCNIPQPRRRCRIYSEGLDGADQSLVIIGELNSEDQEQQLLQEVFAF